MKEIFFGHLRVVLIRRIEPSLRDSVAISPNHDIITFPFASMLSGCRGGGGWVGGRVERIEEGGGEAERWSQIKRERERG